ncbi:MAG: hypothetical protein J6B06_04435 [Lachnospiraceae bacterium]|nr:hypothetical protein [Lachnospiraceae bacterium]
MKVENAAVKETVYQTKQHTQKENTQGKQEDKGAQVKDGTVFAGNLNLMQDSIAQKREEARRQAMGLISKQFQSDLEIDTDLEERSTHIDEVREENNYASHEIARLEKDIKKFKEEYGAEDAELADMYKQIAYWKEQIYEGDKAIHEELMTIRATKEALLKRTNDMTDAAAAAEDIMDAASDEIIGMLRQEAIDKIEEDRKEEQEKVEEAQEKKEEKEELIEKKQEQEKLEELTRKITTADEGVDREQLQREIEEILAKQKLLQEDLKGLAVDTKA